jgi:hypothetical protein
MICVKRHDEQNFVEQHGICSKSLDLKPLQHIGQSSRFSIAADFLRKLVVVTFLEIIIEDILHCFDNLFSLIIKKKEISLILWYSI